MELIKCQCNRVILFLTREDMKKYHIDREHPSSFAKSVRTMLKDADESVNLSDWYRILVKIFESKEGGCELFITRLGEQTPLLRNAYLNGEEYIYRFRRLEDLLCACKALSSAGFNGKSRIFYDNGPSGDVFLLLDRKFDNLREFGALSCRRSVLLYIEEHCTPLLHGDVRTLGTLA